MLRFRLGQQWKREPVGEGGPLDAFGLEVDGVELLAGANEEPLGELVPALVEAVASLKGGAPTAQVSLQEAHFELCLVRSSGAEVELTVASLARPARLVHGPLRVDLAALIEATVKCGEQWLGDWARGRDAGRLSKLRPLGHGEPAPLPERDPGLWGWRRGGPVAITLEDADGRSLAFARRSLAALPCLMLSGSLTLEGRAWNVGALPLLGLLELVREAASEGTAVVALGDFEVAGSSIFSAGLEACVALHARNPALAGNPHLVALSERCTRGLAALRPIAAGKPGAAKKATRAGADPPLPVPGALRRLRFEPKWERSTEVGDHGRLLLTRRGPVVISPHAAWAFDGRGKSLQRRVDSHGVAASREGPVITANAQRVAAFEVGNPEARWFRDHDGVKLGPELFVTGHRWITSLSNRGAVAWEPLTGREVWRMDPPRTGHAHLSVVGDRVLLATDAGSLYGLDVADGQGRFRIRSTLPFPFSPVPHGKRALGVLTRADRTVVFLAEVSPSRPELVAGGVCWTHELSLSRPCVPVVSFGRAFIAGHRDARAVVQLIGRGGELGWSRAVPSLSGRLKLVAFGRGVVVCDARGAAAGISAGGEIEWVLGAAGEELLELPTPALRRGVLVLAGETIRAVDPRGGRVLAELPRARGLLDCAVDARLNVYTLDDVGALRAWRLGATLAVV